MSFSDETVKEFQKWLGQDGRNFFSDWIKKNGHGWYTAVVMLEGKEGMPKIPHPIHSREGMSVRNWMRTKEEFKHFTAEDYDESWHRLVEYALSRKGE